MSIVKRSASERLEVARAAQAVIAEQIADVVAKRRAALRADHDLVAAAADHDLAELRLAHQRAAEKIEFLLPVVEQERQDEDWPEKLPAARELVERLVQRQRALNNKPRLDRSAGDQNEIDVLASRVPALRQHIALLERVAA